MFLIDINWTWHIFGLLYNSHQSMHFHFTVHILKELCSISSLLTEKNISALAICHIFQVKMQLVCIKECSCRELTTNINFCSFFLLFTMKSIPKTHFLFAFYYHHSDVMFLMKKASKRERMKERRKERRKERKEKMSFISNIKI